MDQPFQRNISPCHRFFCQLQNLFEVFLSPFELVNEQIEPFDFVNERTNEKLTLMKRGDGFMQLFSNDWLLKRCPIGETAMAPIKFAATATILVLVRTNAGSAQNLAMRLRHAYLHMTPKRDSAQKSHAVCAIACYRPPHGALRWNEDATVRAAPEKATRTKHHRPLQKNTCFVMVWQNMDGQRLDDGIFGNFHFCARLLVWDSFRCHISEDTKKTIRRLALHSAVIPGGTTKYIQMYNDWMAHGEKATTSGGNLKAPPMEVYLEWIANAWDSLPKQMIADSFLTCGISKEEKGRHDDKIHVFKPDGAIPNGLALLEQHRQEEEVLKMVEEIDLGEDESDEEIDVEVS
ncbi:hypothetical protein niasHT_001294 [Heterodera trifolii]|uniref:DDE-1 domain-containing protein n=1 Tax=Heterodera trifolii TaxID=157864 RepID=A0ABD2M925_9BILA